MEDIFFYSLYSGLFNKYPKDLITNENVLICYHTINRRIYYFFETFDNFFDFLVKIPKNEQFCFEIIIGNLKQKPHFDIDISKKQIDVNIKTLSKQIQDEITQKLSILNISPNNLRWYSSHSEEKQSLHLIIPDYYHNNNLEAKNFYQYLISQLPKDYVKFIDNMVYSSLQNFRILGSQKPNSNRPKKLCRNWFFSGEEITLQKRTKKEELLESLITKIPNTAKHLDFPYQEREIIHSLNFELEDDFLTLANQKILAVIGNAFHLREVQGTKLCYQRDHSSLCPICCVVHDSIWQFAVIYFFNDQYQIYLFCPRAKMYCKDKKPYLIIEDKKETEWIGEVRTIEYEQNHTPDIKPKKLNIEINVNEGEYRNLEFFKSKEYSLYSPKCERKKVLEKK